MSALTKLVVLASLAATSLAAPCDNATSYLDVTLYDAFGDGWQDAWWVMEDPGNVVSKDQPTCVNPLVQFSVHPCEHTPAGGYYYMIVQTPDNSLPEGWWEMIWRVDVVNADGSDSGVYYIGQYNTTMVWYYDSDTDTWTLSHSDNLVTDLSCTGCTGGKCKPKPKPKNDDKSKSKGKGKQQPLKGHGKKGGKGGDSEEDTDGTDGATAGASNSTEPHYGPRAVNLRVDMFSEDGDGWNSASIVGSHWYISDYTLHELFDDGSLCSGWSGHCHICLGDGSYVFRVTGPPVNETDLQNWFDALNITESTPNPYSLVDEFRFKSWEFCHTRGSFGDQLKFHVKKGECYPDDLRWVEEICDLIVNSTVTCNGVVALSGITSELFSSADASAILNVLASQVAGWSTTTMSVLGTSLDVRSLGVSQRSANSFTHDIQFSVSFLSEAFGVDGTNYAAVENLVEDIALTLENAFASGTFVTQLTGEAKLMNSEVLEEVSAAELVSLEVVSISYTNSHLVYYYDNNDVSADGSVSYSSASGLSNGVIAMFVVVAAVGFVAFVGIVSHGFNGYSKLPLESQHVGATTHEEEARNPFVIKDEGFHSKRIPRVVI